jgi:hypothetical protein
MSGTVNVRVEPPVVPVKLSRKLRAVWVALELDNVRVSLPLAKVTSAEPTMASSIAVPKLVFVTDPHVVAFSPVVIN